MNEQGATPSHVLAENVYSYGIPALIGIGVVASVVFALLLWALTRAVRELASASRAVSAAVGLVGESRSAEAARAEERHQETLRAIGDVKATVVARP